MSSPDKSMSFYLFDIDDNLCFLPTRLYLWNAESQMEQAVDSGEFARVQNYLGRSGEWQAWATTQETFRDFRDRPDVPPEEQTFVKDLLGAVETSSRWRGPSWPLLV